MNHVLTKPKSLSSLIHAMTKKQALGIISQNLPSVLAMELDLACAVKGSITICCTVNKIVHEWHAGEDIEEHVTKALEVILRSHFR